MIFPINLIAGWLLKKGMGDKSGPLAWVIAVVVLALAAALGWQMLKGSIIDDHMTRERGERAEQQLERQEEAQGVDDALEDRDQAVTDELKEGAHDAAQADPDGAARPVGPVSRSVHDGLRQHRSPERQPPGD